MAVRYHPLFEAWLTALADNDEEVFGEVMALLNALEQHGRDLDDDRRDESHPVVTSRFDMHALRRTPPTETTPYADHPPVLRLLYAYATDAATGEPVAVVLIGGDKTALGNAWYPPNVNEANIRFERYCSADPDLTAIIKRGNR